MSWRSIRLGVWGLGGHRRRRRRGAAKASGEELVSARAVAKRESVVIGHLRRKIDNAEARARRRPNPTFPASPGVKQSFDHADRPRTFSRLVAQSRFLQKWSLPTWRASHSSSASPRGSRRQKSLKLIFCCSSVGPFLPPPSPASSPTPSATPSLRSLPPHHFDLRVEKIVARHARDVRGLVIRERRLRPLILHLDAPRAHAPHTSRVADARWVEGGNCTINVHRYTRVSIEVRPRVR